MLDRMVIKGDFLRDYTLSFEKWQEGNGDTIEAIVSDEGDLLESFKWYCRALFHDYETNHPEMKNLDRRTKKYKIHLKNKAVCEKIRDISEGLSLNSPEEVLDEMSTEIEQLYEECPDKSIIMEAAYTAQIYVYAAKCQEYYKKRYYVTGQNIAGYPMISGVMFDLHDIVDVVEKGIEVYETAKEAYTEIDRIAKDSHEELQDSCIIRCYPVLLDGNFEPVKVRLFKILSPG